MFLYAIVTIFLGSASAQNELLRNGIAHTRSKSVDYLLPNNVRPSLYQLELEPNFDTDTFRGRINITLSAASTQNTTYTLVIGSFSGKLNNDNEGFYLAEYTNAEQVIRKLATTNFQPTYARKAFPCFDEPALKAIFEISVIRTKEYQSISNARLVQTELLPDGRFKDIFAKTVMMSTYLVAFVVSDFTFIAENNQRVFGRPGIIAAGRGDYALSAAINILNIIEEYVGVPYSLPKMDQIGIPDEYFNPGAMENWGLVTYGETYLIFDTRLSIAEIIAHEFGHQWFGNIVSPIWWTYLWLNEGLATYFQCYAASIEEKYDFNSRIVTSVVQYALSKDSSNGTRPMNQDAGSPKDLDALFDDIAYEKSGSVVRMAEGILSKEIFRRGLHIYQNKMKFKSAEPSDLYSSWQQALNEAHVNPLPEGEDMESVMTTWDSNAGYPLLTVARNYTDGTITISQRRFIDLNPNNDDESIWFAPISYATQSNPMFSVSSPRMWLAERSTTIELEDLLVDDWIIVNIQQSAFYRVNYDYENWYRIIDFLDSNELDEIHSINRAQIVDDSFVLAQYGVISYEITLDLSQFLARETSYAPLQSFVNALSFLDLALANTMIYDKFQDYVLDILDTAFNTVGLHEKESDDALTKLNRENLVTWMCDYGHEACENHAIRQLREWQQDEEKVILPYLQIPLFCAAMRIGKQTDWAFVFKKYMTAKDPKLRINLLSSLMCIAKERVAKRYLKKILENINSLSSSEQYIAALYSIYASGDFGTSSMRNYFRKNWPLLRQRFTPTQLSSMINQLATQLFREKQFIQMKQLALDLKAESIFKEGIDTLKSNIIWAKIYLPSIIAWLNERY